MQIWLESLNKMDLFVFDENQVRGVVSRGDKSATMFMWAQNDSASIKSDRFNERI